MSDKITLRGVVGTPPRTVKTDNNLVITSFRLATSLGKYDRVQEKWIETDTNWYTVTAFRQLATNTFASVQKGDRVVVAGALKVRDWKSGERSGTTVDVEADSIGHDLVFGTGTFTRSTHSGSVSQPSSRDNELSDNSYGGDEGERTGSSAGATDEELVDADLARGGWPTVTPGEVPPL